jgi:hypothetical protein
VKKFWTWFKEKAWPWIKLLPRAVALGIVTAFGYDLLVSGSFKLYIYVIGILLAIPGFYVIIILSRLIKRWEYKPEGGEGATK